MKDTELDLPSPPPKHPPVRRSDRLKNLRISVPQSQKEKNIKLRQKYCERGILLPMGLLNPTNRCFQNAVFQLFASIPGVLRFLRPAFNEQASSLLRQLLLGMRDPVRHSMRNKAKTIVLLVVSELHQRDFVQIHLHHSLCCRMHLTYFLLDQSMHGCSCT